MMYNPRVTVLMAVYNAETYLAEAIESILKQSFTDFEFLIIEDASQDQSAAILERYAAQDSRIRLIYNPQNIGLTRSLNQGLKAAKGVYIARQDADDISLPNRLAEQVAYLDSLPSVVLVGGELDRIDAEGCIIGHQRRAAPAYAVAWGLLFYNYVGGHSGVMFRREVALALGGYDETRRYSQDYELWLRLLSRGQILIAPRVWLKLRQHGANISTQQAKAQEETSLKDSQAAMAVLLGDRPPLKDVAALRGFWLEPFPPSDQAMTLQIYLKALLKSFTTQQHLNRDEVATLRGLIAARYLRWARSLSLRRQGRAKLALWRLAATWDMNATYQEIKAVILRRGYA